MHVYKAGQHLGLKGEEIEHTIPSSYLFRAGSRYQIAIIKGATAEYKLSIEGQGIAEYNLTIVKPQADRSGLVLGCEALAATAGSSASITLGKNTVNVALQVDTDGDGDVDESFTPDSAEVVRFRIAYLPVVLRNR